MIEPLTEAHIVASTRRFAWLRGGAVRHRTALCGVQLPPGWQGPGERVGHPMQALCATCAVKGGPWAVVQDLRPFGFRVESTHPTMRAAEHAVACSRYLQVMPLAQVQVENARLEDPAEFDREVDRALNRRPGIREPQARRRSP